MNEIIKKYTNGEVTVVWQPSKCIHSTICFRGLPDVFDPAKRPWVNIQGAATERIVDQVKACPSGALSYFMNAEEGSQPATQAAAGSAQVVVETVQNGPLLVTGAIGVKDKSGNIVMKEKTTAFCRCGGSNNKPYCDGTHSRIGFKDE